MKILLICLLFSLAACNQNQNDVFFDPVDTSADKRWRLTDFPIRIDLPMEMAEYSDNIVSAGDRWSEALGFEVFTFVFGTIENNEYSTIFESLRDETYGIYRQDVWDLEDNQGDKIESSTIALTTISSISGRIIHADILFNFRNHSFSDIQKNPNDVFNIDFESTLIHELGHYLGLLHISRSSDTASVMVPEISSGYTNRELSEGDILRIRQLYVD